MVRARGGSAEARKRAVWRGDRCLCYLPPLSPATTFTIRTSPTTWRHWSLTGNSGPISCIAFAAWSFASPYRWLQQLGIPTPRRRRGPSLCADADPADAIPAVRTILTPSHGG
jgi:hypothetical protein